MTGKTSVLCKSDGNKANRALSYGESDVTAAKVLRNKNLAKVFLVFLRYKTMYKFALD